MPNEGFNSFSSGNFDPNTVGSMTSTVILVGAVIDVSPSISKYVDQMNTAMSEVFMQELKSSHRKDDIMIMGVTFCEDVKVISGFQPILNLPDDYLVVRPQGRRTALYDAVNVMLDNMSTYRKDLEAQGIEVRSNIFIITDGDDNISDYASAGKVKDFIDNLRKDEAWMSTFTFAVYGVGDDANFESACKDMGLDPSKVLAKVGISAKEIRDMMGVVSKSVSSSSAKSTVSF